MSWFQEKTQARKTGQCSGPNSVRKPLRRSRTSAALPPILAFADFKQPFILHTDASGIGLGVVVYQVIDGQEHVIRYGSHSLNKGESCYPAHKLEFWL